MTRYEEEISSNLERADTNLQVASALLLNEGLDTSKHSGVIALIHQHFVKNGKLNKEQGRNLPLVLLIT